MKQLSFRKLSLLGLILLAASAVTAAILPKKSDKKTGTADGRLQANLTSDNGNTCRSENAVGPFTCNDSESQATGAPSSTSHEAPLGTSGDNASNNTSHAGADDTITD